MPRDLGKIVRKLGKKKRPAWLDDVDAREFLEELGMEKIDNASMDELVFSCPFPGHDHGDERPSAFMNNGIKVSGLATAWKCHGCNRAGNAITFLAEFNDISYQRASNEIRERFVPNYRAPRGGSMRNEWELRKQAHVDLYAEEHPEIVYLQESTIDKFAVDWEHFETGYEDHDDVMYMYDRGFTTKDLIEWEIGFDPDSNRITIPIRDHEGRLVGFKGRAYWPKAKSKYRVLGDTERTRRANDDKDIYGFAPYLKTQVVFGIHKWGEQKRYVWDEGELNVIAWKKMNVPAFSTGSASMSTAQALVIREFCDEVVMFVDDNRAGDSGVWGYENKDGEWKPGAVELLSPFVRVYVADVHSKDANEYLVDGERNRARALVRGARRSVRLQAPESLL